MISTDLDVKKELAPVENLLSGAAARRVNNLPLVQPYSCSIKHPDPTKPGLLNHTEEFVSKVGCDLVLVLNTLFVDSKVFFRIKNHQVCVVAFFDPAFF